MVTKPKDEMLPGVKGVRIDVDDKDNPKSCLVGLVTEEGMRSFTLNASGASMMIQALQTFVDSVESKRPANPPKGVAH